MAFKIVIKSPVTEWNAKKDEYETKVKKIEYDYDGLAEALVEFLDYVIDDYYENSAVLKYIPKKKGKK